MFLRKALSSHSLKLNHEVADLSPIHFPKQSRHRIWFPGFGGFDSPVISEQPLELWCVDFFPMNIAH